LDGDKYDIVNLWTGEQYAITVRQTRTSIAVTLGPRVMGAPSMPQEFPRFVICAKVDKVWMPLRERGCRNVILGSGTFRGAVRWVTDDSLPDYDGWSIRGRDLCLLDTKTGEVFSQSLLRTAEAVLGEPVTDLRMARRFN